ncbi:MAG: VWA domain-containing protein, partial [Actinomycetota bacterium]
FNRRWARRVTAGGPIAVIISDGWDRGDPQLLATEMDRLSRSVHRVVWLNPLASRPGFSPETRGMRAALPHVDDFLAAGRLRDLASVVDLLESVPERRSR